MRGRNLSAMRVTTLTAALTAALSAVLTIATPARATAQAIYADVGGGSSIALTDAGKTLDNGPHGMLGLAIVPLGMPLGLELSGRYARISGATVGGVAQPDLSVLDGSLDLLYRLKWSRTASIRPWIAGGVGAYRLKPVGDAAPADPASVTKLGLNGGAGIALPVGRFSVWVEGRFHSIFTSPSHTDLFTATLGVRVPIRRPPATGTTPT